jgi:hypothetical protein
VVGEIGNVKQTKDAGDEKLVGTTMDQINQSLKSADATVSGLTLLVENELEPVLASKNVDVGIEYESNDQVTHANELAVGRLIQGEISSPDDRDYFRFLPGTDSWEKLRLILRKTDPRGFQAETKVYDWNERKIAFKRQNALASGVDAISFSFDFEAGKEHFVLVRSNGSGQSGSYELIIRSETADS